MSGLRNQTHSTSSQLTRNPDSGLKTAATLLRLESESCVSCGHDGECLESSQSESQTQSNGDDSESDRNENPAAWDAVEDNSFGQRLIDLAVLNDPEDAEWVPRILAQRRKTGELNLAQNP